MMTLPAPVLVLTLLLHAGDDVAPSAEARGGDGAAGAEDDDDEPRPGLLGGTIVTAERPGRDPVQEPSSSAVFDQEAIRRRGVRTLPRLLETTTGVLVQETSYGQGSPYVRGFTGFRNLFLIDGIRLNNSVFRDGPNQYWNTVDPFGLERVEVVKGPGSVLHGSDAIGGTVLAHSRRPDSYGTETGTSGRLHYRFASAERSHVVRADASASRGDELGVRVGATGKSFGDVRGGERIGTQEYTGYDEWDADLVAEAFLDASWSVVLGHQTVRQNDVPRTHQTVFAEPFAGSSVGSDLRRDLDQTRHLTYVQLHGERLDGLVDGASFGLSWHEQEESRDRIRGSGARQLQGFEVDTLGVLASFEAGSALGTLTWGLDYYRDQVSSFSSTNPIQGPVADDATYELFGLYLQDEVALSEAVDLILGGRFQWAGADARKVQDPTSGLPVALDDTWSQLVGSVRFVARLVEDVLALFGGVSQGFRAPNLSDLTRLDSARTNEFEVPAPGLEPERTLTYELGTRVRTEASSTELAVFYTDVEDAIVRFPTGATLVTGETVITKANLGAGYVFGVEAGGAWSLLDGWTVSGSGTYLHGELDTFPTSAPVVAREYIDRLMPLTLRGAVGWEAQGGGSWAELGMLWFDDAGRLSTRDEGDTSRIPPGGTPGDAVFHLRGGTRLTPSLTLDVGLENASNEDYRVHGSGSNAPGRSLVVGLTYEG